ncbi:MAG: FHA domain-containing protein [Anaerolineales bacterium]
MNEYFAPLRVIYSLSYTSTISTSGDHTLGMYVDTPAGQIPALDKNFTIDIQPPNPIFVSQPLQITREPSPENPYEIEALVPAQQNLEIIVEFPDGHKRNLKRTTLYVDGEVVDENKSAPFTKFTWDLSTYHENSQHELVVEAEDELGLKKSSVGTQVTLNVIQPPRGLKAMLARYRSYLVLGAIGLAGLALLIIIIRGWVGHRSPSPRQEKKKRFEDPVTQPVAVLTEAANSAKKKSKTQPRRTSWLPARSAAARVPEAPAYLIRLTNGGEPASAVPIPVSEKDMTFGTDPVQSVRVLDDPSIAALHARIKRMEDGAFILYDHGSIAGTWVNYEPVTREGTRLTHGDTIHFGQLVYRFNLSQPPAKSEPKVIKKNQSDI